MAFEDVLGNETHTPVVPDKGQGKDDYVPLTRAQAEGLQRDRDEARQSERYWAERARGNAPTVDPAGEPEERDEQFVDPIENPSVEGDTPEKLVDDLAAKGVEGLRARGFITAADAQRLAVDVAAKVTRELIGRERQKMTTDNQIMSEFPELRDPNSELFKETAKIYQQAVAMDPNAKKTPAALFLAARAAKAGMRPAPQRGEDRDDGRESEADRRHRANSQDARPRGRSEVDDSDMLGSEAKQIIAHMGISEQEFRDSQKLYGGGSRGRR